MFMVSIDQNVCEGCGECADSCPEEILSMNGEKALVSGEPTDCAGCETCVSLCPSGAVKVEEM